MFDTRVMTAAKLSPLGAAKIRRRDPKRMIRPGALGFYLGVAQALPIAETLLRQVFLDQRLIRRMAGCNDSVSRLVGAL